MKTSTRKLINKTVAIATLFCMSAQGTFARFLDLADVPLFIGANVPPQVMLTISKEQQLYKKAYNDYSDLDGDGLLETTYKHDIDYYGYFDSYKCYKYTTDASGNGLFVPATVSLQNTETDDNGKPTPAAITDNNKAKYCASGSGFWSGNFLNWIAMSRMDTVRKLLYGGMRSTDTPSATVLERAHLPTDGHAWSKYYGGKVNVDPVTGAVTSVENDIDKLTPFSTTDVPITTSPATRTALAAGDFCTLFFTFLNSQVPPPPVPFNTSPCGLPVPVNYGGFAPSSPFPIPNPPANSSINVDVAFTSIIQGDPGVPISVGDQVLFQDRANPARFFRGVVLTFPSFTGQLVRVKVHSAAVAPGAAGQLVSDMVITNLSRTGISFCNVTYPKKGIALSHQNEDLPLIRAARGNFQLWNASQRWQCKWREEYVLPPGVPALDPGANGNLAALSGINASADNPSQAEHALPGGDNGDFVARVAACVKDFFGTERCKQYPGGNYKPIGLLQVYGDTNLIQFGLVTGSYQKNISGGVLRKNVGTFNDEVNVGTDGTFTTSYRPPNLPRNVNSSPTPAGIVNTLNYIRIWGYDYSGSTNLGGTYNVIDNCPFQQVNINEGFCTSWGNPMSEVFFESLRYFAGKSPSFTFTNAGSKDNQLGLPLPNWADPLKVTNYCSPLNVLMFNASVSTNDDDLRTTAATDINSASSIEALTNTVGTAEGITGGSYFVGKIIGTGATPSSDRGFELCTPKSIPGLGQVSGICPEGPTLAGSYLMAGLAYQARTNRIRSDLDPSIPTSDTRSLKVTTYGIQLATNVPTIVLPVTFKPDGKIDQKVIIQPIYRLQTPSGFGGGTLMDLRFVDQKTTKDGAGNITGSTGKIYINWEDSEQGGDFDQDMWGTLEWALDVGAKTIKITTTSIAQSTNQPQGFGYSISGTTQDGPHFHSGLGNVPPNPAPGVAFNFPDPGVTVTLADGTTQFSQGCIQCRTAADPSAGQKGSTSVTYTLGTTSAQTLQDPMWYAAKYGAFVDGNSNNLPDQQSEWDSKLSNGQKGSDGIPDTYFLVTNPLGLVAALDRAFVAILSNASASSVATNSTSLQTNTTIYQARFNGNDWSGQVLAFSVSSDGKIATDPIWDAGQIVNSQDPLDTASAPAKAGVSLDPDVIKGSGRTIITVNDSRTPVPFRWPADPANPTSAEIGKALIAALNTDSSGSPPAIDGRGKDRLNYLRGSQANEGSAVTSFRVRPISRLGDIVNSNPNFVGPPSAGFGDAQYTQFRTDNVNRKPVIYVGGNDGMLHAFRADDGREVLAYVPSMIHNKLSKLTDKKYVGGEHRYFVDGSPEVGDAFITVGGATDAGWHTVLVSAMGGGGQGLFALDVTKPADFTEANASKIALWEFTDKDDPDLGFIYAQPTIRRMANGRFAAIVPGGYNNSKPEPGSTPAQDELACTDSAKRLPAGCTTSSTGSSYLFVIYLDGPGSDGVWDEGVDYVKIRAAVSTDDPASPNGLTQPLAADIDADGFVDFIYAGDLQGNLWKFDVRLPPNPDPTQAPVPNPGGDTSTWVTGDNRVILFVARDPDTNARQPITGKPEATLHPQSGFIVTFGTGKYIERNDPFPPSGPPPTPPTAYQTQSFYGIWDKNDAKPIAKGSSDPALAPSPNQTVVSLRDQLLVHVIAASVESSAIRVVVPEVGKLDVPDWSTDTSPPDADDSPPKHMGWLLDFPNATSTGERSVFRPILTAGRLIFTTLLPLTQACQFGGTSFTMVIDPTTGGRIDGPVLDTDANGLLNSKDVVSFGAQKDLFASGLQSTIGITPTPTIIREGSLPPNAQSAGSQILGTSGPLVASSGILLAYALAAGSSGGNASTVIGLSAAGGRVSWRMIQQ